MAGADAAKIIVEIESRFNKAGVKRANAAITNFNNRLTSLSNTAGTQFTNAFSSAVRALTKFSSALVQTGVGFEQAIQNIVALRGAGQEVAGLASAFENRARSLGASTAYTATEVAEGMLELSRAGLGTAKVLSAIEPALFLAGAQGSSLAASSKLLARTFAQFSLEAEDAAKVADTFTTAMQNSLLSMQSLDTSMRYAGGAAGSFGHDIQETTAAVALFMNQTGLGSTAGTQFRQVLLSLGAPTRKARKALERYGIAFDKVNPKNNNFAEIMQNLKPMMNDTAALVALVSKRSSGSLQKILQGFHGSTKAGEEYFALLEKILAQSGVAEATYKKMIDTVGGQFTILQSKIQEAFLTVFDAIKVDLKRVIKDFQVFVDNATDTLAVLAIYIRSSFLETFNLVGGRVGGLSEEFEHFAVKGAVFISKLIASISSAIGKLKNLIPVIKTVAKFMATIFIVTKVTVFIRSLVALATTIGVVAYNYAALKAGTLQFSAAMKAATLQMRVFGLAATGVLGIITFLAVEFMTSGKSIDDMASSIEDGIERLRSIRSSFLAEEKKIISAPNVQDSIRDYDDLLDRLDEVAGKMIVPMVGGERDMTKEEVKTQRELLETIRKRVLNLQKMKKEVKERKLQQGELYTFQLKSAKAEKDGVNQAGKRLALDLQTAQLMEKLVTTQDIFFGVDASAQVGAQAEKYLNYANSLSKAKDALDDLAIAGIKQGQNAEQFIENILKLENARRKIRDTEIKQNKQLNDQRKEERLAYMKAVRRTRVFPSPEGVPSLMGPLTLESRQLQKDFKQFDKILAKSGKDGLESINLLIGGLTKFREETVEGSDSYEKITKTIEEAKIVQQGLIDGLDMIQRGGTALGFLKNPLREMSVFLAKNSAGIKALEEMSRAYGNNLKENLEIGKLELAVTRSSLKVEQLKGKAERDKSRLAAIRARMKLERKILEENEKAKATDQQKLAVDFKKFQDQVSRTYKAEMSFYGKSSAKRMFLAKRYLQYMQIAQDTIFRTEMKNARESFKEIKKNYDQEFGLKSKIIEQEKKEAADKIKLSQSQLQVLQQGKKGLFILQTRLDVLKKEEKQLKAILNKNKRNKKVIAQTNARLERNAKETKDTKDQQKSLNKRMKEFADETKKAVEQSDSLFDEKANNAHLEYLRLLRETETKYAEDRLRTRQEEFDEFIRLQEKELSKFADNSAAKADIARALADARKNFNRSVYSEFISEDNKYFSETLKLRKKLLSVDKGLINNSLRALGFSGLADKRLENIQKEIDYKSELSDLEKKQEIARNQINATGDQEKIAELADKQKVEMDELNHKYDKQTTIIGKLGKIARKVFGYTLAAAGGMIKAYGKAIAVFRDKLKSLVNFMTDGMSFNPFDAIKQGVDSVIESEEELKQKHEELQDMYKAGRISDEDYASGMQVLQSSTQNPAQQASSVVDDMFNRAMSFIDTVIQVAPVVMEKFASKLPVLLQKLSQAIPQLIRIIARHLPTIIMAFVDALSVAIPAILNAIMEALPQILPSLFELFKQLIFLIIENIPMFIKLGVQIIAGIIKALPDIIQALINAMPAILQAFVDSIDILIEAIIEALPMIVQKLIALVFELLFSPEFYKLLFKLFIELAGQIAIAIVKGIVNVLADAISEVISFGSNETKTFGDTPRAQYVPKNSGGQLARFAAGDYFVAAKDPSELLRQSLEAVGSKINMGVSKPPAPPPSSSGMSSSEYVSTNIAIVAEGRLLDSVQVMAMDRGHAPKMSKKLRKASGVKVGFDRGNYQKYAKS